MKTVNVIIKVVTALAAITGIVYLLATYGDKIVDWARNMLGLNETAPVAEEKTEEAPISEEATPAEKEEVGEKEVPVEETPAEAPIAEDVPVADESDFEG